MLRTDYHTHTPLCLHADGTPEEFVARARELHVDGYGIADHMPMPEDDFDDWRMPYGRMPEYLEWIGRAKAAAPGTGVHILAGMECDWLPGIAPWIKQLRGLYAWDYLIGSVHYLTETSTVDDAACAGRSICATDDEDWRLYGKAVADMVGSGLFDIVGHMDLVKIWGRKPQHNALTYFAPTLDALESSGMVVELNTAGWYKKCAEQYPSDALLQELLRRHIPIAIDSDAHTPAHLSRDWQKALRLLDKLACGKLRAYEHPALHSGAPLHVYGLLS